MIPNPAADRERPPPDRKVPAPPPAATTGPPGTSPGRGDGLACPRQELVRVGLHLRRHLVVAAHRLLPRGAERTRPGRLVPRPRRVRHPEVDPAAVQDAEERV